MGATNRITDKLTEMIAIHTKVEITEISIYEDLTEIGVDSIVFTQMKNDVIQNFGIEIPFSKIYGELNTIHKIAGYIEDSFNKQAVASAEANREGKNGIDKLKSTEHESAAEELTVTAESLVYNEELFKESDFKQQLELMEEETDISLKKFINEAKATGKRIQNTDGEDKEVRELTLTKEQENILAQCELSPDSLAFNEAVAMRIKGEIDIRILEKCLNRVVKRHEALRTVIDSENKKQIILNDMTAEIDIVEKTKADTSEILKNIAGEHFELNDRLFRVKAVKESERQWILILVAHHMIADGWSIGVLYNEMKELYNSSFTGENPQLKTPVQFREYIKMKNEIKGLNDLGEREIFGGRNLSKTDNYLELCADSPAKSKEFKGARYEFTEDREMLKLLRKASARHNTSSFNTMLALFIAFLSRVTRNRNITVGVPLAGQNLLNAESLIGNCVEMIGVEIELHEVESLKSISDKVKKYFEELEAVSYFNNGNPNVSYNVVFSMNRRVYNHNLYGTEIEYVPVPINESKYDMFVSIIEVGNELHIRFDYNRGILSETTVKRWTAYFREILRAGVGEKDKLINELDIIPEEETKLILNNLTTFDYEYVKEKLREAPVNYGIPENSAVRLFVLDNDLQTAGIGISGEIYIGMNEVEIYNTGMLGRILESGELIVLGEETRQIMLKGRNISLFRIEEVLRGNSKIQDVACEYDYENSEIKAYIVEKEKISNATEIAAYFREKLPAYMLPHTFIRVSNLDERNNGEIIEFIEELNYTEEKMLKLWTEVLKIKKISIEDDFFNLGGNSLYAMKLMAEIQNEFNKKISIKELFKQPTIKELSKFLASLEPSASGISRIMRSNNNGDFAAASVQKRIYALHKIDRESLNYNVPFAIIAHGNLEIEKLDRTINKIIERHETLRTCFEEANGRIIQRTAKNFRLKARFEEKKNDIEEKAFIDEKIKEFVRPFDLNKLPLIRVEVLKVGEKKHFILLDFHHIVFDGASSVIFAREFAAIYGGMELPELEIQYKDYAAWYNELVKSGAMKKQEEYWRNTFIDGVPVLGIRPDLNRPVNQTFKGDNISFKLTEEISYKIDLFCRTHNVTAYMFFLAVINILLSKYSGQEDIVIGTVVEGRNHLQFYNLIGMFVNTIVMRNKPVSGKTFVEFLNDVGQNTLNAFDNSEYLFEDLLDLINAPRDASRNPLFDVMFVFQNNRINELNIDDLKLSSHEIRPESSRLDLSFEVRHEFPNYNCNIEYNTDIFRIETIRGLKVHLNTLLKNILSNAEEKISDIEILCDTERNKLLFEFNESQVNYPKDKTIHQLFEEQVERTPDNIAIIDGEERLTYGQLNRKANQLAGTLRKNGVAADSIVGIMVERSVEMIIGVLGVLKAGGGYLPIDISYPAERIEFILKDSGVKILLIKGDRPSYINYNCKTIDLAKGHSYLQKDLNLEHLSGPRNTAYIIYTSGTTGKPKGAILEHRNVVRLFFNDKDLFDFNQNDTWTMFHSYCFDFSIWEMYGALLYGGRLVMVPETTARETKEYLKLLKKEKITILNQTPSAFYNLSGEEMKQEHNELALRYIIFGGEELKTGKLKDWKNRYPNTKLINMYGITETTVHVTYKEITDKDIEKGVSNIGRPIPTLSIYILDKNMRLLPFGAAGEICVSGEGLARGYLNRPELTAEKFITNPFVQGEKMYRSGDLARWMPEGELEYLGRIDDQVKIRGHRIELGEIEAALNGYYGIKDCVVTLKKGVTGEACLAAYVIPRTDADDIIGVREKDENLEQVGQWEKVFDGVYNNETLPGDETFNIVGWNSSYTGKPIPEREMAEWLNTTIERILRYKPEQVLEVGCGTGMILYRIAPDCNAYCATDLSSEAVNYVKKVLKKNHALHEKITLINAAADDFSQIKGEYDFAIFNSIVQYFPSMEYLIDVLEKTINVLKPGSVIYLGDIRNYSLLKTFHTSVALYKSEGEVCVEDLRYHIEKNIAMDSELVIDPVFFYALKKYFPRITHTDVFYKAGGGDNELTLFRYDVALHIGTDIKYGPETQYNWGKDGLDLEDIKKVLEKDRPEVLRIADVPSGRVSRVISETDAVYDETDMITVGQVRDKANKSLAGNAIEFEEFRQMVNSEYNVETLWAGPGKDNCFNVVFIRNEKIREAGRRVYSELTWDIGSERPLDEYVNNPLKAKYLKSFVGNLKNYLKTRLPEYMIPSYFIQLERLPLTSNGKIDRKALPEPDINWIISNKYEAPQNKTEEKLAEIWSRVLGVGMVGINDNFFDLGGHSLNATVLTGEIHRELNVEIPLSELFKSPTIKELSVYIQASGEDLYESIESCEEKEYYEASSAQKRLYILQQLKKDITAYNMPAVFQLDGEINSDRIETAFKKLIKRHEALRTYFETIDGEIVQKIDNEYEFKIGMKQEMAKGIQAIVSDFIKCFELEKAPLFRVELAESGKKNYLLIDMHHIISDGVSVGILIKEFTMLYNGIEPEPLKLQYKDFAQWQNRLLKSGKIKKQKEYWRNCFKDEIPVLSLPCDYERPAVQSFKGDSISFSLDEKATVGLRAVAKENESTVNMVLLSVLNILLSKYSGQDCIVIGVPVAGRPHADLQGIMGMFVNTLALRNYPKAEKTFKEFLKEVKENSIRAYENQSYQFEALIEEINVRREPGRNPLFDVMLSMINTDFTSDIELDGLTLKPLITDNKVSKFDLILNAVETGRKIGMSFDYSSSLFKRSTIERAVNDFKLITRAVSANTGIEISKIQILSEDERRYILREDENMKDIKNQNFAF